MRRRVRVIHDPRWIRDYLADHALSRQHAQRIVNRRLGDSLTVPVHCLIQVFRGNVRTPRKYGLSHYNPLRRWTNAMAPEHSRDIKIM
jgi:hypothetical protein